MAMCRVFQAGLCVLCCYFVVVWGHHDDCQRPCTGDGKPRVCRYKWLLENYLTLSRACFQCPHVVSDCLRPQCVSGDGVQRSIRTINRQIPAFSIQVCEGDTVEVEVINQMVMSEGVTIHWHGILQRHSPHMDGVAMVTQCPVPTGANFTYRFVVENPGTHFFHSHSGLFRTEGLFGGIVVRQSPSEELQWDLYDHDLPEHLIVLSDWPHRAVADLYSDFFHSSTGSQVPESILINGRGIYPPTAESFANGSTATPLAEFHVQAELRYRFRLINAGALRCPIQFSIDDHDLILIASDGHPFQPFAVQSLVAFSGERYDFVLHAKKCRSGVHWIRARGLDLCEEDQVQQFAILKYDDGVTDYTANYPNASMDYHTTESSNGIRFNHWLLTEDESFENEHAQIIHMRSVEPDDDILVKEPDHRLFLEFAFRIRNNIHFHDPDLYPANGEGYKTVSSVMVNNISNILPPSPILTQLDDLNPEIFCDASTVLERNCSYEFCQCTHRLLLKAHDVVEIVVYNSNDQDEYTHPLHLHGHSFRVVAYHRFKEIMNKDRFKDLDKQGLIHRKLHGAPLKDTIPIPNGGILLLRIKADNPGAWYMHCHLALHNELGMALILQVNNANGQLPPPPPDFPRCGNWPETRHHNTNVKNSKEDSRPRDDKYFDNESGKSTGGSWLIPLLATLTAVNVVLFVISVIFWRRGNRKYSRKLRLCGTPMTSYLARESSMADTEDETSKLLGDQ